jgi:hypothetical protein
LGRLALGSWEARNQTTEREREREEGGSWCLVAGEFLEVQRGKRWKTEGLKKAVAVHAGEGGGLSI